VEEAVAAVKDRQYSGRGPLHMAAWAGRLEMCMFLVEELHLNVNAPGDDGNLFVTSTSTVLADFAMLVAGLIQIRGVACTWSI
jgi:ankyrin repeat protein